MDKQTTSQKSKVQFNSLISIMVLITLFMMNACNSSSSRKVPADYIEKMIAERKQKDLDLVDTAVSRFNKEERTHFSEKGLQYFQPDTDYVVEAIMTVDTSYPVFQMPTTTDRKPNYRIYGFVDFELKDTSCRLVAYQNMDFKDDPEYGGYLFIPFKDMTNEFSTYGGGRYLDVKIPATEQFLLDFNTAYNPYCAYSDRWSCPLVPLNNTLELSVFAGEKAYK